MELKKRGWSLRECVKLYNYKRLTSDKLQEQPPLNKDFLYRIKKNKFEVANQRVAQICDFLEINLKESTGEHRKIFENEFQRVELLVTQNPNLKKQVQNLLNSVLDFAEKSKGTPV